MSFFKKILYLVIIGNIFINSTQASDQSFLNWIKEKADEMSSRVSYTTSDVDYGSSIELIDPFLEQLLPKKMNLKKGEFTYLLTPEDEKGLGSASLLNLAFQVAKSNFGTYQALIASRNFWQNTYVVSKELSELKKSLSPSTESAGSDPLQKAQADFDNASEKLNKAGAEYGLTENVTETGYFNSIKTLSVPYLYKINSDNVLIVPFTPRSLNPIAGKLYFTDGLLCIDCHNSVPSLTAKYFKHLLQAFPNKQLCIYGMSYNESHITYPQIKLTSSQLDVTVYDSMFNMLQEEKETTRFFTDLNIKLGTIFNYQYKWVGNQVFNMHDCGRFATIYLLYDLLENKTPLYLKPQDIQKGFKLLKDEGYENFQKNPDPNWVFGYLKV